MEPWSQRGRARPQRRGLRGDSTHVPATASGGKGGGTRPRDEREKGGERGVGLCPRVEGRTGRGEAVVSQEVGQERMKQGQGRKEEEEKVEGVQGRRG